MKDSFQTQIEVNELLLDFNNPFFEEKKSSLSVFTQDSENDQLYRAAGLDPDKVPGRLKCCLIDQIFTLPVKPKNTNVGAVELSALQYWFDQSRKNNPYRQSTHPLTGQVLDMKSLVVDMELAKEAKDFVVRKVTRKVTRIGNLLIYSSRLFVKLERATHWPQYHL